MNKLPVLKKIFWFKHLRVEKAFLVVHFAFLL